MHLYLVSTINELKCDEQHFFRMAHVFAFKRDVCVANDVAQWRLHAIIPPYVVQFLRHRQALSLQPTCATSSYERQPA